MILAIDIGGTKFSMAAFAGDHMVRRESRATDAEGGREWIRREYENGSPAPVVTLGRGLHRVDG